MSVSSVLPESGPTTGSTVVTVAGANFVLAAACKFGSLVSAATVGTSTVLQCLSPAQAPSATVSVEVSNNWVEYTDFRVPYLYYGASFVHLAALSYCLLYALAQLPSRWLLFCPPLGR